MTEPQFKLDWFSRNLPHLHEWMAGKHFANGLEVGCFEGRSSCHWLGENIVGHLTCVDAWADWKNHPDDLLAGVEQSFDANVVDRWPERVAKYKGRSVDVLAGLLARGVCFDFAYVDGDHEGSAALTDIVLCWHLLPPGGVLLFDDYGLHAAGWNATPADAMKAFLRCFKFQCGEIKVSPQYDLGGDQSAGQVMLTKN